MIQLRGPCREQHGLGILFRQALAVRSERRTMHAIPNWQFQVEMEARPAKSRGCHADELLYTNNNPTTLESEFGKMAEWLWRVTQAISLLDSVESILMGSAREGSNPSLVIIFGIDLSWSLCALF